MGSDPTYYICGGHILPKNPPSVLEMRGLWRAKKTTVRFSMGTPLKTVLHSIKIKCVKFDWI